MTADNTPDSDPNREPPIFSAVLTPHRSLSPMGFLIFMAVLGGISFVTGMVFLLAGAWPVFGFFGLDVLLVWWAFKLNYRAAQAYEQVTVTPSELTRAGGSPSPASCRRRRRKASRSPCPARWLKRNAGRPGRCWNNHRNRVGAGFSPP